MYYNIMGGKPCIRGMRVTVGLIVGLVASGYSNEEILNEYSYLEIEDINQALVSIDNIKAPIRNLPL
jgi:uncharacterized protein (DUF433 family)